MLQQYLPLAVLKLIKKYKYHNYAINTVATVLTACGIETYRQSKTIPYRRCLPLQQYLPLAVLKRIIQDANKDSNVKVATVLTACGIETVINL